MSTREELEKAVKDARDTRAAAASSYVAARTALRAAAIAAFIAYDDIYAAAIDALAAYDKDKEHMIDPKERLIRIMGTFDLATGHADTLDELLDSLESELRDVLGHYRQANKDEFDNWRRESDDGAEEERKDGHI